MNRDLLRTQLPNLVRHHLPRNARTFRYQIYDNKVRLSPLGIRIDPLPFKGTVIAKTDEALIIKTGRISFAIVDRHLATDDPDEGVRIEVTPYARRRADGMRADTPTEETQQLEDGRTYTVQTVTLGGNIRLPLPAATCPELAELIQQIENLPAPDGVRSIANLLIDANARDFACVDPEPELIIDTPPAVRFTVSTAKFSGEVAVIYDRGLDVYIVELRDGANCVKRVDPVYFDTLGETLEQLIDDGTWRRIHITLLSHGRATIH